jgi:hypothetical protein
MVRKFRRDYTSLDNVYMFPQLLGTDGSMGERCSEEHDEEPLIARKRQSERVASSMRQSLRTSSAADNVDDTDSSDLDDSS